MTAPNPIVALGRFQTATTGTGTITFTQLSGFPAPASILTTATTYSYSIPNAAGGAWEFGSGVVTNTSGTWTLTRPSPTLSSNSNNPISLSGTTFVIIGDALPTDLGLLGVAQTWTQPQALGASTVTTAATWDSSTLIASTAMVQNAVNLSMSTIPLASITGGTYSFASLGSGCIFTYTVSGSPTPGPITSIGTIVPAGGSYAVGDIITPATGGNRDAMLLVTSINGSNQVAGLSILYGGTGYVSSGAQATVPSNTVPFTFTLTGTLGSNALFIMPNGTDLLGSNQWIVNNNTTGAYNVTFKISNGSNTATGTGVVIPQGTANSAGTLIETDGSADIWIVAGAGLLAPGNIGIPERGSHNTWSYTNSGIAALVSSPSVGTTPEGIYVQGRYAYVTNSGAATVSILDISNPASPSLVSSPSVGTNPYGIYVQGRYAYVTNSGAATVSILDISNPASPSLVSSPIVGTNPYGIYVQGRYAYVTNKNSATVSILDISNPASPSLVSSPSVGTTPVGIYVQGRYAYVTNSSSRDGFDLRHLQSSLPLACFLA